MVKIKSVIAQLLRISFFSIYKLHTCNQDKILSPNQNQNGLIICLFVRHHLNAIVNQHTSYCLLMLNITRWFIYLRWNWPWLKVSLYNTFHIVSVCVFMSERWKQFGFSGAVLWFRSFDDLSDDINVLALCIRSRSKACQRLPYLNVSCYI